MHSTKWKMEKIWTIGVAVMASLLISASAQANDGDRIDNPLEALVAISSMPFLAFALAHGLVQGGHHYADHDDGYDRHRRSHLRTTHRRVHRHSAGCGHARLGHRPRHHNSRFHPRRDRRHQRRGHH